MATNKKKFIQELIDTAQENIWKNELALAFNEQFGEGEDKEKKSKATEYAIGRDKEYITFLKSCESSE